MAVVIALLLTITPNPYLQCVLGVTVGTITYAIVTQLAGFPVKATLMKLIPHKNQEK